MSEARLDAGLVLAAASCRIRPGEFEPLDRFLLGEREKLVSSRSWGLLRDVVEPVHQRRLEGAAGSESEPVGELEVKESFRRRGAETARTLCVRFRPAPPTAS